MEIKPGTGAIDGQHRQGAALNKWDAELAAKAAQHIAMAKKRIAVFDKADGKDRRAVSLAEQLGDIAAALETAFAKDRWDFVADAMVMLSQCTDPAKVRDAVQFNTFVE